MRGTSEQIQMRYYDTYSLAQVVKTTLDRNEVDYIRTVHDFFCGDQYCRFLVPYRRWSALHDYIFYCLEVLEGEQLPHEIHPNLIDPENLPPWILDQRILPIEDALHAHQMPHQSFRSWAAEQGLSLFDANEDHFVEYHEYLSTEVISSSDGDQVVDGPRLRLYEHISEEVFFLMFPDRVCLLSLNDRIASAISHVRLADLDPGTRKYFQADGVLKRAHLPTWVKRAVFFRERGRCAFCGVDLSGLVSTLSSENYDHIVPLARGGANDITNLQLLCAPCNLTKRDGAPRTSPFVERWYESEAT